MRRGESCGAGQARLRRAICHQGPPIWTELLEQRQFLSAAHPVHAAAKTKPAPKPHPAPAVHVTVPRPVVVVPPRNYAPPRRGPNPNQVSLGSYEYGKDPNDNGIFPEEDGDGDGGDLLAEPGPTELPISITPPATPKFLTVGGAWTSDGPAPILNGQIPGAGAVSGRIAAIAASPTDANTIYIAAAGGGIWKTTNGGTSWTPLTDAQTTTVMGAIALAPSNPNIIYAGTGEPNNSADSYYGRGILKSIDGGTTWTLLGSAQFFRHTISAIVIDPANPNIVYAAVAGGGHNGVGGSTGIWKTTDGGTNWTNTTTAINSTSTYSALVMDPSNSQTLYCTIGTYTGATANGLYKTINGGTLWTPVPAFPTGGTVTGRISLAISATNSQVLYASASDPSTSGVLGVYTSTNGGATWSTITPSSNYMGGQGWYDQYVIVSPTDANTAYVAGAAGSTTAVMKSSDGGASWTGIATGAAGNNGPHADHHAVAFDASGRLLDGNDGGIWRLDNATVGSIFWTDLNANLQLTQYIGIAIGPTDATTIFGGAQDNGTSQLNPGATTFTLRQGGDGGDVSISPNAFTRDYHIAPVGSFGRSSYFGRSDNGGTSWSGKVNGIGTSDPTDFYPPFVVDPNSFGGFDRLLLGTNRVYESIDNAENWTPLSTPSTAGWTTSSNIDALAVAPSDVNTIYASAAGSTFVTTNHGTSWTQINISGGTDHIQQIVVDPTNSQIAYAVRDRFGGSKVFRTTNGGTTWTSITGNLADVPAYSIVFDPNGPGTADDVLYVGTDAGVFTSSDLGTTWNQLGTGLPTTEVHSLQLNQQNVLAAGTYGRGIWQISVGAPTDNVVASQDGNEAHLIWAQYNPGGETGFLIQRSTDGGAFATVGSTGLNQTTFIDTTTAAGHTYRYQVQMKFSASSSAFAQSNLLAMQSTGEVDHVGGFFGASDLTLNGAKLLGNGRLQLPDGNLSESRTAFLTPGSGAIGNFYTEFNFQFTNPSADGMTFTIQSNAPTQVGRSGGDLGYGGITNSLSIIFNLYSNVTQTGLFTGGATNGTKFGMTSLGNAFHVLDANGNTDMFHVVLSYNGSTKVLNQTVVDTGNSNTFNTSYSNIDLAGILHDQAAYVGFTGGTGGLASTQQIVNWWWSPVGNHPPFQINGTTNVDSIYLKADADHTNIDYWLNASTSGLATGKFAKTFSGVDVHGLGSADIVTIDQSAGDVMLGQDWLDSTGAGGSISLNIIGSTGNDTYLADPSGNKLTFATNGASISAGKVLNLANVGSISFVGNGGNDVITSAGAAPFTLTLGSTGTEDLTVTSGNVTAILPLNNDALTINNIGGTVLLRIG